MGKPRTINYEQRLSETQNKKRKRRKYPNVFFKKEMLKLFGAIDNTRTMIASLLTFFCALRISEVCRLKWVDIDLEEQRLKVVEGKNYKDGFVPISPLVMPILKRWREMNPDEIYFLPSDQYKTGHLESSTLYKSYKDVLKKAGMLIPTDKNSAGAQQHQYKFHTLRHSRCTHLLSNGIPVQKVQKFMRHDKIETTMTYTWILDKEMNTMVKNVDMQHSIPAPMPHLSGIQQPLQTQTQDFDPLKMAQKRLACGEISVREYKKLEKALNT